MGRSTRLPYRQRRRHISSISHRGLVQHDGADELVASRHPTPRSSYKWRLFHFVHVAHCPWTSRVNRESLPRCLRVIVRWFLFFSFFFSNLREVRLCVSIASQQTKEILQFFLKEIEQVAHVSNWRRSSVPKKPEPIDPPLRRSRHLLRTARCWICDDVCHY